MDLLKKLKRHNKEFRKDLNPLQGFGLCGGRPKTNEQMIVSTLSEDDPTNF